MRIASLFSGYEKAYGQFSLKQEKKNDKQAGRALTIRGAVTEELWKEHLAGGEKGLGIIPLREDDSVVWGAIDVDQYNLDHADLERKIKGLNLPLIVIRSKSGGAHCCLFCKEPLPATDVQAALTDWAARLGHAGCEIFPKQTSRVNENDIGNWLNMPYYHAEKTIRFAYKDGQQLSLDEFCDYAESMKVGAEALEIKTAPETDKIFYEGPPCLQHLYGSGGFPEGQRNSGLYNAAVYLRKRYPEGWQDRVMEYNQKMCSPPLGLQEVNALVKSVSNKNYEYGCKQPPIVSHCQKRECVRRKFGVGDATPSMDIEHITKYAGDPVLWFVEIGGTRVMLTTEELLSQTQFKRKCADALNRVPISMSSAKWDRFIDERIQRCDVVEVPEEATPGGQFRLLLEQYLTGQAQATSKEELVNRMTPFRNGHGEVWFRSRGLLNFLSTHGYRAKSEHHVWQMLRELGAESKFIVLKGTGRNVWVMKEPSLVEEAALPSFGSEEF